MESSDFLFYLWLVFRSLFIVLVIFFVVSGLDDLFFDLVYYVRGAFRALFRRKMVRPVTRDQLDAVPEKPCAIVIPCWHEAAVIARMLLNTISTVDYRNYYIFVGTYPNDEATRLEVEKVRQIYPNIEVTVTPSDGPTNKADCLNWVYQGILLFEIEHGMKFEFFVMHDSEDLVHPLSLKYFNYLIPRFDFIQLPVHPVEARWTDMTVGVYMDEFAESHSKDMRVREVLANSLPSAGVGTALSRATIEFLARKTGNQIFDIGSLTEDYLMGVKLESFEGRKIFLQQGVERVGEKKRWEAVATRGMFPDNFQDAVRQKSRWILGIGLQGWSAGWGSSLGSAYCLYRDRKGALTNLLVVVGYVVFGFWAVSSAINASTSRISLPPLVEPGEVWWKFTGLVLAMLVWRILNRVLCTWRVYGARYVILLIPRLIYGNVINFCATWRAIVQFVKARVSGVVPAWVKTEHSFPTEEQLRRYHRRIGDLLLDRRWVTADDLQAAVARQKETGAPLGQILVEKGVLAQGDLEYVLAVQGGREQMEVDPNATPSDLVRAVPRDFAEQYGVFPIGRSGRGIVLAASGPVDPQTQDAMREMLGQPIVLRRAAEADVRFAIARAYAADWQPVPEERQLGVRLLRKRKIDEKTLRQALRTQRRTHQRLGDVLVELGALNREQIEEEVAAS